ncbi:hypothetical protein IMSHALPRED_002838 [Imshaugia aleurites]|uniref:Uncharacterized protein n=1 Tax=Imshaugia aleurites TaxID=172621 RepID=A0A8H3PJA6_9LECA|nr:hypothetical protein IMSHALPRED_002838 [Imshaugia aleurites]
MAVKAAPLLPQIPFHETRRLHSEIPGKGSEDVTQRPDGTAGEKFSALVSSSSPMPKSIQIIEGNTAATSGGFNEPATKTDSTGPNMSSKDFTKSTCPNQSSSNEGSGPGVLLSLFFVFGVPFFVYLISWEMSAQRLTAQIPNGKIFTEREALRKEEEGLKLMKRLLVPYGSCRCNVRQDYLPKREKELAEKVEKLDRKEWEHLRQRAMVLERKLKAQNASIETEKAPESPREAVHGEILPDEMHTEKLGLYSEQADLLRSGPLFGIEEEEPLQRPKCGEEKVDPPIRQVQMIPSTKVVPQVPSQGIEVNETPKTEPHHDDSMAHTKPDSTNTGPPRTKPEPSPAPNQILESLSADNDAAKEEMGQIKRAKEALKSRERELEAQAKDRKKRTQELNAPKPERIWSIASGMLLGSVLAFGVTMMMSIVGN